MKQLLNDFQDWGANFTTKWDNPLVAIPVICLGGLGIVGTIFSSVLFLIALIQGGTQTLSDRDFEALGIAAVAASAALPLIITTVLNIVILVYNRYAGIIVKDYVPLKMILSTNTALPVVLAGSITFTAVLSLVVGIGTIPLMVIVTIGALEGGARLARKVFDLRDALNEHIADKDAHK